MSSTSSAIAIATGSSPGSRRRCPLLSGGDQRRWLDRLEDEHDDIRAILDRAVAKPDPAVAIGTAFAMWRFWQKRGHLAEARRTARGHGRGALVARRPATAGEAVRGARRHLLVAGRARADDGRYEEALSIWQAIADEGAADQAELANAYYNASFTFAITARVRPAGAGARPGADGPGLPRARARDLSRDRRHPRRGEHAVGHRQLPLLPRARGQRARAVPRRRWPCSRRSATTRWRPGASTCWGPRCSGTDRPDEARGHILRAIRQFYAVGDAAGLTLTLDDLSAIAVVDGDFPRAARLRGAARNLTRETGAQLAGFVEDSFEEGVRPGDPLAHVGRGPGALRRRGRCAGRSTRRSPTRSRATRRRRRRPSEGVASVS